MALYQLSYTCIERLDYWTVVHRFLVEYTPMIAPTPLESRRQPLLPGQQADPEITLTVLLAVLSLDTSK